jgi:hypothetical protein
MPPSVERFQEIFRQAATAGFKNKARRRHAEWVENKKVEWYHHQLFFWLFVTVWVVTWSAARGRRNTQGDVIFWSLVLASLALWALLKRVHREILA